MKKLICPLLLAATALMASAEPEHVVSEISSPDRRFSVKIIDRVMPGADSYTGFFTLVLQQHDNILSEHPTIGYLMNAFWSPDETLVAINNRRGIGGDYLWVLSLKDGKALKTPDDAAANAIAGKASTHCAGCDPRALDASLTETLGWKNATELVVRTRLLFEKKTIAIDRVALYRAEDDKLVLVSEKFERIQWPPTPKATPMYYSPPVPAETPK
jgi:hypothetical protein